MFACSIRFQLPEGTDWNATREFMRERAKLYAGLAGLRSKAFLIDPDRREVGANYVWETREAHEAFLRSDLFRAAVEKMGQPREIRTYEVVAYVDNAG